MSASTPVIELKRKLSQDDLTLCERVIQSGGVIAFPTDTVYGLGCNAFDPHAIEKIYKLKGRSYTKPLPILLPDPGSLSLVASDIAAGVDTLISHYWPGALTLVFKTGPLALHAARGKSTIAVRVPDHALVQQLLHAVGVPLATTSANKSNHPALASGAMVKKQFLGKVDLIIDGGDCPVGQASTVLDVTHSSFTVLRQGAIDKAHITKTLKLG